VTDIRRSTLNRCVLRSAIVRITMGVIHHPLLDARLPFKFGPRKDATRLDIAVQNAQPLEGK
jgi:hypothetical protein